MFLNGQRISTFNKYYSEYLDFVQQEISNLYCARRPKYIVLIHEIKKAFFCRYDEEKRRLSKTSKSVIGLWLFCESWLLKDILWIRSSHLILDPKSISGEQRAEISK